MYEYILMNIYYNILPTYHTTQYYPNIHTAIYMTYLGVGLPLLHQSHRRPLGSPADRTGQVEMGATKAARLVIKRVRKYSHNKGKIKWILCMIIDRYQ